MHSYHGTTLEKAASEVEGDPVPARRKLSLGLAETAQGERREGTDLAKSEKVSSQKGARPPLGQWVASRDRHPAGEPGRLNWLIRASPRRNRLYNKFK
jgi:hypothetical protein